LPRPAIKDGPAAMAAFYSKDAVILPPMTAEPIKGEADIKKFWAGQQKLDKLTLPVSSAKMLDPKTMYVTGAWSGDAPGANGAAPTHVGGTWLGVMVLDGADWKVTAGTWQIVPPPGAQAAPTK
jgi:ketosteroid isomerase-like protein